MKSREEIIQEAYIDMVIEREFKPLDTDEESMAASKFKVGDVVTTKKDKTHGKVLSRPDSLGWHKVEIEGGRSALIHTTNLESKKD